MTRPKRAAAAKAINYAAEEESEMEVEGLSDSDRHSSTNAAEDAAGAQEYADDDEEKDDFAPQQKKARSSNAKGKAKAKVRGRTGKLQSMVFLPLEVWYNIAECLDPPSLLYMGRANKMMRSLFASKSSQGLWNLAKRSVHLPELEATDLNDLALASLIYDRDCHICGKKSRAVLVDYNLRKRWCKKCRSDSLILARRLPKELPCLDPYTVRCSLRTIQGATRRNWNSKIYYFRGDVISIDEKLGELQEAIEDAGTKEERDDTEEALAAYVAEREATVAAAFRDGEKLAEWSRMSTRDRREADRAARDGRKAAIKAKLNELGYEEQDTRWMSSVESLLDRPTALTTASWKKISPKVIQAVEKNKQDRLSSEARQRAAQRRDLVRPYYEALRESSLDDKLYPDFLLFVSMPAIHPFWKEEDSMIDEELWHTNLDQIQEEVVKAQRWIKLEAARALIAARDEVNVPVADDIRLSIHVRGHVEVSDFETALDVDDPSTISSSDLEIFLSRFTSAFIPAVGQNQPRSYKDAYSSGPSSFARGLVSRQISRTWLRRQAEVLAQTGFTDDHATGAELSKLGPKFSCHDCHKYRTSWEYGGRFSSEKSSGLTWEQMVKHAFEYHRSYTVYSSPSSLSIDYADRKPASTEQSAPLDAANSASTDGTAKDKEDEAQVQASGSARDDSVDAVSAVQREEDTTA